MEVIKERGTTGSTESLQVFVLVEPTPDRLTRSGKGKRKGPAVGAAEMLNLQADCSI